MKKQVDASSYTTSRDTTQPPRFRQWIGNQDDIDTALDIKIGFLSAALHPAKPQQMAASGPISPRPALARMARSGRGLHERGRSLAAVWRRSSNTI
jgi:hypothetical protein